MTEQIGRSPASQGRATGLRPQPPSVSSQSSVPNAALLALAERVETARAEDQAEWLKTAWQHANIGIGGDLNMANWSRDKIVGWQNFVSFIGVGAFVDAAMTLVPEGWGFTVHRFAKDKGNNKQCRANVEFFGDPPVIIADVISEHGAAPTPALALTAACLRALAASGMSAFGQDPKGLEAKPASPVAKPDAHE